MTERTLSDEGYARGIAALLRKRAEKLDEAADCRARLGVLQNDLEAIERVMETMGYDGELPTVHTRQARIVLSYRNELRQWLKAMLREHGPQTSRDLAERMVSMEGKDTRDHRLICDLVRRMGKALRTMRDAGIITSERTKAGFIWAITDEGTLALSHSAEPSLSLASADRLRLAAKAARSED